MPEIMTISQQGQITLPAGLRAKYGLKAGDKVFGEETEAGFLIRGAKKNLLDYEGCLASSYSIQEETEIARKGLSRHVLEDSE